MLPTQKKHKRKLGRPELDSDDLEARSRRRKTDGERLAAALRDRLSQAEASRQTGIRQGSLNAMVNGERDINREDLRRLGAIGISADYLLGNASDLVAPGQTRTKAKLSVDLADRVSNEIAILYRKTRWGGRHVNAALFPVDGEEIIEDVVRQRFEAAIREAAEVERYANGPERRRKRATEYTPRELELYLDHVLEQLPRVRASVLLASEQQAVPPARKRSRARTR